MTGYTRKDTTNNIADGNIINADDLDNEFDGVQAAFHASTGHTHDGTAAEGAAITKVGPVQDVLITTAAIYPKTTNTVDLGTSSLKYKDAFIAGNETVGGTLAVTGVATLTAQPVLSSLTASQAVFTNGTKGLVSNAITGTGNVVMSASPTLTGTANVAGLTASEQIASTQTGSATTGAGQLYLNGATSNRIDFNSNGATTPSFTTRSDGTKITLFPALSGSQVDYAIGISAATQWYSVPVNSNSFFFKWFGGETQIASLDGTGVLTLAGNPVLSGGTANGVTYLNGSKVLTSGTALTFDGTIFKNDNASAAADISIRSASGNAAFMRIAGNANALGTSSFDFVQGADSSGFVFNRANAPIIFGVNNSEAMRLTSTGLGIGTTTPGAKLSVRSSDLYAATFNTNNTASEISKISIGGYLDAAGGTGGTVAIGSDHNHGISLLSSMVFYTNNGTIGERMRLDSSGNLGLGVTPSAWGSGFSVLQLESKAALIGNNGATYLGNNWYSNAGNKYIGTGQAALYAVSAGVHSWFNAPSGTAGNPITFTQAMTLDASGNLGIGTTSPAAKLDVFKASSVDQYWRTGVVSMYLQSSDSAAKGIFGTVTNHPLSFYTNGGEQARIDTSGNLGIGTTTPAAKLDVNGGALIQGLTVGRGAGAVATNTAVGASALAGTNTGIANTGIGYFALNANTIGANNTAVASGALEANISGLDNSAFGARALRFNTIGSYNSAFGRDALFSNTASNNTAVGYQAGYGNTIGTVTAFGYQAGFGQTTGTLNTFLGQEQGSFNSVTGASNSGVGHRALLKISSGSYNTAIGQEALRENTTASNNTAVGYQAGYSNQTGAKNVYFGKQAGYAATGSYNTIVGEEAGLALSTGVSNTFVGAYSGTTGGCGELITTGSKNTILGAYNGNQGGLDIRTANNYIVLSDGDGNPRAYWNSSGRLLNPASIGFGGAPSKTALQSNVATNVTAGSSQVIYGTAIAGNMGAYMMVIGVDAGGNWFCDFLTFLNANTVTLLSAMNGGSPGSRTYSVASGTLSLNPSVTQTTVTVSANEVGL